MSSQKSLLIVDDDAATRELIQAMLDGSAWRSDAAASGEEALALLAARSYDLVLTDIVMPGIDGIGLLSRIHAAQPDAKVIVMTADSTPGHIISSLRERAAGYLSKPFGIETLEATLSAALSTAMEPDDIRLLSDRPNWISLVVRCKLSNADRLTQFVRELPADLDPDQREAISTAFRELLMNAIEHGGRLDPGQKVELSYVRTARCIIYYIRDPGEGFSLENLPHAAISNTPDKPFQHAQLRQELGIRPGGFGLLLTRNFADEVLYNAKGNEVMLIKYL